MGCLHAGYLTFVYEIQKAWFTYILSSEFQSKLEFQLRLQEFIELVRADENLRAISYARKYLAPWGATYMKELQRVVATLAFRHDTECTTYKVSQSSSVLHLQNLVYLGHFMLYDKLLKNVYLFPCSN